MRVPLKGAIDCDVHVAVPGIRALVPYLDDYWRERVAVQQLERLDLSITSYPPTAPISRPARLAPQGRPAWLRPRLPSAAGARPVRHALRHPQLPLWRARRCSPRTWRRRCAARSMTGSPRNGSTATRGCAPRSWCRRRTPSLPPRRSSVAPRDPRFVQVLLLAGLDMPLGPAHLLADLSRRREARPADRHPRRQHLSPPAERQRLALAIYLEDYVSNTQLFAAHAREPRVRGRVPEIPGAQGGADRIRLHLAAGLRVEIQQDLARRARRGAVGGEAALRRDPRPCPPDHAAHRRARRSRHRRRTHRRSSAPTTCCSSPPIIPHWQFDGDEALPPGLDDHLLRKILIDNPLATYSRLKETVA